MEALTIEQDTYRQWQAALLSDQPQIQPHSIRDKRGKAFLASATNEPAQGL
jgi:hypothetical protein